MLSKNNQNRFTFFYPERDIMYKTFSGEAINKKEMKEQYKIDTIKDYSELANILEEKTAAKIPVLYRLQR